MSLDIYNEGRVVGYSAYETYIKQFLSENPEGTPATEREWLASSLASGASLIVEVPAEFESVSGASAPQWTSGTYYELDDGEYTLLTSEPADWSTDFTSYFVATTDDALHTIDIDLPTDTALRAANFIIGNWVNVGVGYSTGVAYPTKITSYSNNLIPNTAEDHPVSNYIQLQGTTAPDWVSGKYYEFDSATSTYEVLTEKPANWDSAFTDYYKLTTPVGDIPIADPLVDDIDIVAVRNYLKIQDGVVLQEGTWSEYDDKPPEMSFVPDMSSAPAVRLLVNHRISKTFYILLTGFTDMSVLMGTTGVGSSLSTNHPQNGDYLGPAAFPWAAKIIFNINSQVVPYLSNAMFPNNGEISHNNGSTTESTGTKYASDSSGNYKFINLNSTEYSDNPDTSIDDSNYNIRFESLADRTSAPWWREHTFYYLSDGEYIELHGEIVDGRLEAPSGWDDPSSDIYYKNCYIIIRDAGYLNWAQLFMALSDDKKIKIINDVLMSIGKYVERKALSYDLLQPELDPGKHLFALPTSTEEAQIFGLAPGTGYGFTIRTGRPYINFMGRRLYVATSETNANSNKEKDPIPNGSIGIGWTSPT